MEAIEIEVALSEQRARGKQVNVTFPKDDVAELEAVALERGESDPQRLASTVRAIVQGYLLARRQRRSGQANRAS